MRHLTLSLFGPVQCSLADDLVVQFAYDKVQALLAYLATETDRPHRRETIAGLLWPDAGDSVGRHNLNQAVWSLRRSVGDRDTDLPVILSTRESLQFNPAVDCSVDVQRFRALVEMTKHHAHRRADVCRYCADWLSSAVDLYRGPFMAQFSMADSSGFEEWMLVAREHLNQTAIDALSHLVDYHEHIGDEQRAIAYLNRLLELDAWREDDHRRLMRLLARTGQRPAALAHFDQLRQLLDHDLGTGVEQETIALRDKIAREESSPPPPTVTLPDRSETLGRLPTQIGTLIGRDKELAELGRLVSSGQHRLITLTGPGGIGKTRLALQLAHEESRTFADGVAFVPLAGAASTESIVQAIADARSIAFHGTRDPREQLLAELKHQDILIVLDNFEHLLECVDLVNDILTRTPHVQIVATSREGLSLYGEYVFPVQSLDVPSSDNDREAVERSGAVQLFLRSAKRANASFELRESDLRPVIHTCQLVGGMPLGIELAAAWTPLLSCEEIAQEIERSLDFLTTSLRNVPERHRSVRAAFDHSWRLLAEHERDVFMRLSVFRGGFLKDAAEQISGATLPVLLALMTKSFLTRSPAGRFDTHELLRQYAEGKLDELPEKKHETRHAHAHYYASFLRSREDRLKGRQHSLALEELIAETENVRASWEWALAQRDVDLLDTLVHVWLFYEVSGRYQELGSLETAAIEILERSESGPAEVALARALSRRTAHSLRIGLVEGSEQELKRSNDILLRHEELAETGLNFNFLAMHAHAREDYPEEQRLLEESIRYARDGGDQWTLAYSLNDLGYVLCQLGDLDRAEKLIRESLDTFSRIGDSRGRAFALNNLGIVTTRRERYEDARRIHQASLDLRRALRNPWGTAQSLTQLGVVARLIGDYPEAGKRLCEALRIADDLRAYPLLLDVLSEIAELLVLEGDNQRARTILECVAAHPSASPSMIDRLRRIQGASSGVQHVNLADRPEDPLLMERLDAIISLVFNSGPELPTIPANSTVSVTGRAR